MLYCKIVANKRNIVLCITPRPSWPHPKKALIIRSDQCDCFFDTPPFHLTEVPENDRTKLQIAPLKTLFRTSQRFNRFRRKAVFILSTEFIICHLSTELVFTYHIDFQCFFFVFAFFPALDTHPCFICYRKPNCHPPHDRPPRRVGLVPPTRDYSSVFSLSPRDRSECPSPLTAGTAGWDRTPTIR